MYIINFDGGHYAHCDHFSDAQAIINALDKPAFIRDSEANIIVAVNDYVKADNSLDSFDLSVRTYNCLRRAGCETLRDAFMMDTLNNVRNLGIKSLNEVRDWARALGYELRCDNHVLAMVAMIGLQAMATQEGIDIESVREWKEFQFDHDSFLADDERIPMTWLMEMTTTIATRIRHHLGVSGI